MLDPFGRDAGVRLSCGAQRGGQSRSVRPYGPGPWPEQDVSRQGIEERSVRGHPGVQDPARFERRLQPRPVGGGHVVMEVHQPVEGRPGARIALGGAVVRDGRLRIGSPLPLLLLPAQEVAFLGEPGDAQREGVAPCGQVHTVRLQHRQGGPLRLPVDVGRQHPLGERGLRRGLTGDRGTDRIQRRAVRAGHGPEALQPSLHLTQVTRALLDHLLPVAFEAARSILRLPFEPFVLGIRSSGPPARLHHLGDQADHLLHPPGPVLHHRAGVLQLSLPGPQGGFRCRGVHGAHPLVPHDADCCVRSREFRRRSSGHIRPGQADRLAEMTGGESRLLGLHDELAVVRTQFAEAFAQLLDALGQAVCRALFRVVRPGERGEGRAGRRVQRGDRGPALGQLFQTAVRAARAQGVEFGPGGLLLLAQRAQTCLGLGFPTLQGARPLRGVPGPQASLGQGVQFLVHLPRSPEQHSGQIATVVAQEGAKGPVGTLQAAELLPDGVEVVEVARHLLHHVVVEPRQRFAQQGGDPAGLDPVPDGGTSQPVEELSEVAVPRCVGDAEELTGDPRAVLDGTVRDVLRADGLLEAIDRQRPARLDQAEVLADPQRGDEEDRHGLLRRLRCPDGRPEGEVPVPTVFRRHPELDPQVSEAVRLLEAVQHQPDEARATRTRGVQRAGVAVQQVREQHLQGLGLACPVLAAQQQPSVAEVEFLFVVLPDIEDACAVQAEARGGRSDGSLKGDGAVRARGHSGSSCCRSMPGIAPAGRRSVTWVA